MEVQMDIATGLIGVAWLAIAALLLWGFVDSLRRALNDRAPLPFFVMLERRGLTATQVEAAAGSGGAYALPAARTARKRLRPARGRLPGTSAYRARNTTGAGRSRMSPRAILAAALARCSALVWASRAARLPARATTPS
jgi:hypothetical protein